MGLGLVNEVSYNNVSAAPSRAYIAAVVRIETREETGNNEAKDNIGLPY